MCLAKHLRYPFICYATGAIGFTQSLGLALELPQVRVLASILPVRVV